MAVSFSLIVVGFVLLILGAGWLVDGASSLAKKFKVSDLAIGLTVVAFGTSMPELVVNAFAAHEGHDSIVLGNIIGSNLFNLFAILGIAGIITPLVVQKSTIWKEIPISLVAALLLMVLANETVLSDHPSLGIIDGLIFLLCFFLFLFYVFNQLKSAGEPSSEQKDYSPGLIIVLILAGLGGLVAGGNLVVDNAIFIATEFGISQKTIGLTIVAAGTSLPELATSVVAALKKKNDIAVGNVVGSNIFNVFFILGISSLIDPIEYNLSFNADLILLVIGTLMLFSIMFIGKKSLIQRWQAAVFLIIFVSYTLTLIFS